MPASILHQNLVLWYCLVVYPSSGHVIHAAPSMTAKPTSPSTHGKRLVFVDLPVHAYRLLQQPLSSFAESRDTKVVKSSQITMAVSLRTTYL